MSLASHRCCARLKILEQAQTFSASHIITLSGLCIHRKAINKDKHLSSGWYPTTDCTPHALRCLEGTTLSNRGQRPRIQIAHQASAWRAVRQRIGLFFYHGLNGLDGWDLFPFPRLTPMQPGSDVHPCKRACLPEPPHLSGLPCWQTERNQVTDISY